MGAPPRDDLPTSQLEADRSRIELLAVGEGAPILDPYLLTPVRHGPLAATGLHDLYPSWEAIPRGLLLGLGLGGGRGSGGRGLRGLRGWWRGCGLCCLRRLCWCGSRCRPFAAKDVFDPRRGQRHVAILLVLVLLVLVLLFAILIIEIVKVVLLLLTFLVVILVVVVVVIVILFNWCRFALGHLGWGCLGRRRGGRLALGRLGRLLLHRNHLTRAEVAT